MATSGGLHTVFYEADSGEIHILSQDEDSAVFAVDGNPNTIPAGPATSAFWAKANKDNREYGMKARSVTMCWTGTPPDDYVVSGRIRRVIYSKSVYDTITIGAPTTYKGAAGKIVGKDDEVVYPGI